MADEPKAWGGINIFRDLGFPDPEVRLAKADAAIAISDLIGNCGLTIDEAAGVAGLEPDVLRGIVEKGRTDGFSIERLDRIYEAVETFGNRRKP